MGTTSDKLLYLQDTKSAIKDAIVAKGVDVPTGTPFREYATKIGDITTGSSGSETADTWARPTQWLALPANVNGVQKVSILNAVFDTDSEFVAFKFQGAFTVDWGDGTVENFASNANAEHKYNYSNVNLNSDTVATFGYKQCIITITPQSGQNLTAIFLNWYHSSIGSSQSYDLSTGFLDIRINSLNCTTLWLGATGTASNYIKHSMLEQCLIGELAVTSFANLFYDCYALQSVSIKDTSNVTSFASMHYNNYALQKMPTYTFRSTGVDMNSMFYNCYSLREAYALVITPSTSGSVTNLFYSCKSLRYIDITINSNINYSLGSLFQLCLSLEDVKFTQLGAGKVTAMGYVFISTRIKESPAIDTSLCTTFVQAFQYCDRLTNLYAYNYSSATILANMLDSCYSLKYVPNFNITASCTNLGSLCSNCWSLEKAPTFSNSSGVTNANSMLYNCKSITTLPSYTFGAMGSTGLSGIFSQMDSLQVCPSLTVASYSGNATPLNNSYSVKRMLMPWKYTFSVANAKMSAAALNEMYSILPTVTGQTVTVTGNYGVSGDDPTIATAKGWTVVG